MSIQKNISSEREIAEIWKLLRETDRIVQETALQMKETDRKINKISGDFDRKWGRLVESLVEGNLVKLLNSRGIQVKETSERVRGVRNTKDKYGKIYEGRCEIDILARNGANVVVVEVKTTLQSKDVDTFLYKLNNLSYFFPSHKNSKIYGAMTYLTVNQSADTYAKKTRLVYNKSYWR